MFGLSYYLSAVMHEREAYKNACTQPVYKDITEKIAYDVLMVCHDRTWEDVYLRFRLHPCIDVHFAKKMVKRAVNKKNVSLGISVSVDLDERKRVLIITIPPHNVSYDSYY